ncbi:hypothetical protein BC940DRAFT_307866 [Gongronella butleri]|nr:hypothetical protein BC940DRAFT_307866 [Gongronella butleri]
MFSAISAPLLACARGSHARCARRVICGGAAPLPASWFLQNGLPVTILGGGISGLSAAYYISRLAPHVHVRLVEASQRLGGWIHTDRIDDDLFFEAGPRAIHPTGPSGTALLDLIHDLNLQDEVIQVPTTHPSAVHRYVEYEGMVNQLPAGPGDLLFRRAPVMASVVRAGLMEPFRGRRSANDGDDESLYAFIERRLNTHVALNLLGAATHGLFAGDAKRLSLHANLPILAACEQAAGSIVLGMLRGNFKMDSPRERELVASCTRKDPNWFKQMQENEVLGLRHGVDTLPRALAAYLAKQPNVSIVLEEPVNHVDLDSTTLKLTTSNGTVLETDHIISALPSNTLAKLCPSALEPLKSERVDVAVVNLAYTTHDIPSFDLDGFGLLCAHRDASTSSKHPGLLGIIFDTNCLGEQDEHHEKTRFTVMVGGCNWDLAFPSSPGLAKDSGDDDDDDDVARRAIDLAKAAMSSYFAIDATPCHARCHVLRQAIPQYTVGHRDRVAAVHKAMRQQLGHKMSVTGASYFGATMGDCVKQSRMLVEDLVQHGALGSKEAIVTGLERSTQPLFYTN